MSRRHRAFDFRTAYIDLLLNLLTAVLAISVISFALIAKKQEQTQGINSKAEMIANMEWSKDIDCDVDIWVRDPRGALVSFQRKDWGIMNIERDDLGYTNDKAIGPDGKEVANTENSETWVLRGMMPGPYTFNIHLYGCKIKGTSLVHGAAVDVPVKLQLFRVNPTYTLLVSRIRTMTKVWEEQTAFTATIDAHGAIVELDENYRELVKIEEDRDHIGAGGSNATHGGH